MVGVRVLYPFVGALEELGVLCGAVGCKNGGVHARYCAQTREQDGRARRIGGMPRDFQVNRLHAEYQGQQRCLRWISGVRIYLLDDGVEDAINGTPRCRCAM